MSSSRKIGAILWLSLIAVVAVVCIYAPAVAKPPKPLQGHRWKVLLDEEFEGNKLNTERWQMYGNPKNRKQQSYFDPKNVTIRGGICVIKAEIKESYPGKPYTSAHLKSKFLVGHGYYEARMKCAQGGGLNNCFWISGWFNETGCKVEIDFTETLGKPGEDKVRCNECLVGAYTYKDKDLKTKIHKARWYKLPRGDFSQQYHIWGCWWSKDFIRFYIDGELVYEIKDQEVIRRAREAAGNQYLMAGLGVKHKPGLFTGAVEPQFYPATMYIDYIKVWQAVPEQN